MKSLIVGLLFFLITYSHSGVYDEFTPQKVETKYDQMYFDISARPLWYLSAVYPFFATQLGYRINEKFKVDFSIGGGINDEYSFNSSLGLNYLVFKQESSLDLVGVKSELWWDKAHQETIEPSISLSWSRYSYWSKSQGFLLSVESTWRWGRGFRSKPVGFFDDISVSPFALGLKLGYFFSWAEIKKVKEVQRLNQF